ncbi:MAG: cation transporter [Herpetosiphonaceae bacterium]|nr:MAG: cation transporter [Herpetosiphonaceae bacterium]
MSTAAQTKRAAALASIGSGLLLTVIKLIVAFASGSLAILSEAAHSALDLFAAGITFAVIHIAEQPPDENHPYGHARAENLGALAETVLLIATALWVLWKAYERIFISVEIPTITIWAFAVMAISVVVDFTRSRALARAAREYDSQALAADAAHFANDMLSSIVVLIGLLVMALSERTGLVPVWLAVRADAIAAAVVAIIALYVSWRLGRRAINALMDDVPHDLNRRLATLVETVPGVVPQSVRVRARFVGRQPYVDVALKVPRGRSLEEAHLISSATRDTIRQELPGADVVVHIDPVRTESEGYTTAVYAAANRLGLSVHNLDVFHLSDGLKVDLDLELPSDLTLGEAHSYAQQLRDLIMQELPESSEVSIHLEPRRDSPQPAVRYSPLLEELETAIKTLPDRNVVRQVDTFLIDGGSVVTLYCDYPSDTPLVEVHKSMARLERALRHQVNGIVRVQIQPEPVGMPLNRYALFAPLQDKAEPRERNAE